MSNDRLRELKIAKLNLLLDQEKAACEASLAHFTRCAWHLIENGTPLLWNWHIDTVCGYLEAVTYGHITRLIINIPPGSLKSILLVMFTAWKWISNPGSRYLCITNEQGLSIRDALRMKQIIQSSWYQRNWPLTLQVDQNEKTLFCNEHNGFRQSQGITAANTGKRGDCVIGQTLVSTEIGDIRIDALVRMKVKPRVLSLNHTNGIVELKKIIATKQSIADKTVKVATLTSVIICTPEHKIYTESGRYEMARNIAGCNVSKLQWADQDEAGGSHKVRKMCSYNPDLYNVPKAFQAGWGGIRQACASWVEDRAVLLKNMCKAYTQPATYLCGVPALQKGFQGKKHKEKVLFSSLPEFSAITHKDTEGQGLRILRGNDGNTQYTPQILLDEMQKFFSFGSDEGKRELAFQGDHGSGRAFYQNEEANTGTGWGWLRYLFSNKDAKGIGGTPYRWLRRKQYPREPNNALRQLSHENTQSTSIDRVISVEPSYWAGKEKQLVYDIQVEGNNNFFANGILVHNCLIIDDPIDMKHVFSDVIRQGVNDTWDQTLSTRLNDPEHSAVILIMQRGHEDDLAGHLLKKVRTKWVHLSIPMMYEEAPAFDAGRDIGRPDLDDPRTKKGELLFPKRFPQAVVDSLMEDLGEHGTSSQLQQHPMPLGGGLIKTHWWRVFPDDQPLPRCNHIFHSWDTAFSEADAKTNTAFSACTRWGVFWHEERSRYCILALGLWMGRVGYTELRDKVKELDDKYHPDINLIEAKSTGISLIQDLRRASPGRVRKYTPGKGDDKMSRGSAVSPMFQSGQVYVPNKLWALGNGRDITGLIEYVAKFPGGAAPCPDIFDTVTQALIYMRAGNWAGDHDDDKELPYTPVYRSDEEEEDAPDRIRAYYG